MGANSLQKQPRGPWALARNQHGLVSRRQLLSLGWSTKAIRHRISAGRLHPVRRGVYAVGRPELTTEGEWMAAVLLCGAGALISHRTALEGWGICKQQPSGGQIHVSVPASRRPAGERIRVHRAAHLPASDRRRRNGVPITSPIRTLIDVATDLTPGELDQAISQADNLGLASPLSLRRAVEARRGQRGVEPIRALLERADFRLTDSELERRFLRLVESTGLPAPLTQQRVNGYRVDFYWPELGLVVETDGLRYHRTPDQQSKDRVRDQRHTAAGLVALRFTHFQVAFESDQVESILRRVAQRQRLTMLGTCSPGELWPPEGPKPSRSRYP
jgi:very-short-patch-repair endonuclease